MSTLQFPSKPNTLQDLLTLLEAVLKEHGDMPLGISAGHVNGFLGRMTVSLGAIGAGSGPMKLVSRGGRKALVVS